MHHNWSRLPLRAFALRLEISLPPPRPHPSLGCGYAGPSAVIHLRTGKSLVDVVELQEFARLYGKPLNFFIN
jgi:hypothetical protein